jgi:hypothetical protein
MSRDRRRPQNWSAARLYLHLLIRMGVRVRAEHVRVFGDKEGEENE